MAITYRAGLHYVFAAKSWCGLFASLPDGRQLLRHELMFQRQSPEQCAKQIKAFLTPRRWDFQYIVGNPELWPPAGATGPSAAEAFYQAGLPLIKGSADRVNGFQRIQDLLVVKDWPTTDGVLTSPTLLVHPDCRYFLRTFPMLVSKQDTPDEIEESPQLYPALGLMYWAMSRPMPRPTDEAEIPKGAIGHDLRLLRAELEAGS